MRRSVVAIISFVLALSGLSVVPAQANGGYCTTGSFVVTSNRVSGKGTCAGVATVPEGITSIRSNVFEDDTRLTSIAIPKSVVSIDAEAFLGASSLTTVTFAPDSMLNIISDDAFSDASALTSIAIPAVAGIGSGAFRDTIALTSVTISENATLTEIESNTFNGAIALKSITIPASVTQIGPRAFEGASSLSNVYMLGDAPIVSPTNVFAGVNIGAKAYIKSTATGYPSVGSDWYGLTIALRSYQVTFSSNGGSAVTATSFVDGGSVATAPTAPTRSGYTFAGWSATDGGSAVTFPYSPGVNADITLFAKWTAEAPTVSTPAAVTKTAKNVSNSIRFTTSTKVLTKTHMAKLKKSVKASGTDATYVITGTAGMLPGVTKAQVTKLAKLRANIVKAYLVKLGINKSNISIEIKITNQGIVPKTKTLGNYLVS